MFVKSELQKLKKLLLYDSKDNPLWDQFLDEDEQKAIGPKIHLISERLFVPKHNREEQKIFIKKLFLPEFDFHTFISDLCNVIHGAFEIRIGLSFLVHKFNAHGTDNIQYFFAIHHRFINRDNNIIKTKSDVEKLNTFLGQFSVPDLLSLVFTKTNSENPFERSGFMPRKLVLCTCWITK